MNTSTYFIVQRFLKVEKVKIISIRELAPLSGVRSKANQLENVTHFLNSGLKLTRSISRNGHAQTIASSSGEYASRTTSTSSIIRKIYLSLRLAKIR